MIDTGGPAFPFVFDDTATRSRQIYTGMSIRDYFMSIRDYFAAKVVQGLWANATALAQMPAGTEAESIASVAYDVADAMLKERSK